MAPSGYLKEVRLSKTNNKRMEAYVTLITEALMVLNEKNGSSRQAIRKYIQTKGPIDENAFALAIEHGLDTELLLQSGGTSGAIRLGPKFCLNYIVLFLDQATRDEIIRAVRNAYPNVFSESVIRSAIRMGFDNNILKQEGRGGLISIK